MTFTPDSACVTDVRPAVNVEPRRGCFAPSLIVLHYTGMSSAAKAIDWLARAESRVSCHYVVDERGGVTQMAPEKLRAWHAGVSSWRGETDVNSRSIGVEIQNPGHEHGYPDFHASQMRAVIALCRDIIGRHGIEPDGVLAHSDVAPERKIDPGEKFDWAAMAKAGVGHWTKPSPVHDDDDALDIGAKSRRVEQAQALLADYGYDAPRSGLLDDKTSKVLRAFQLHFRPRRVDGRLDRSTELTLQRLVATRGRLAGA
ncbi:MAG: N-acetylmuramoyl-L-alanine amidase [Hyphomicrobium sp.]